ncbi:hypothetical protein FACS1894110_23620 [Spirochaetia bacterium]|nr:hypothetical protein FACS1894110_23620 [Spirochaetia bacterium]
MDSGLVYVVYNEWIRDPVTGKMPYKIGITTGTVDERYYGLGLKMPGEFICYFAYEFDGTYTKVEKTLQNTLNQLNVNGEWFNVNEEALEGIRNVCELAGGKLVTEKIEDEIEMATQTESKDSTQFIFNGEKYKKNRLVLAVIKEHILNNNNISFEDLQEIFDKKLQEALGLLTNIVMVRTFIKQRDINVILLMIH